MCIIACGLLNNIPAEIVLCEQLGIHTCVNRSQNESPAVPISQRRSSLYLLRINSNDFIAICYGTYDFY